ncbi:MAG TPA: SpoIVB peptidase S55 domain-containing protein, partial [Actinomycetota bacterium]|nr:SpoIVB peptidase S55 domain-containing protein [Actinomycetota bacterium]
MVPRTDAGHTVSAIEGVVLMRNPRCRDGHVRWLLTMGSVALSLLLPFIVAPPASAEAHCSSPPEVFPIDDLVPGMTATGLTTISGSTPTSFQVEILGVLPDYIWLDVDTIVVHLTGPDSFLDQVGGVFYGMSGSPVSKDGKLIGAVSYAVSEDPTIFGLTPAQAMVDVLTRAPDAAEALPSKIPFDAATRRAVASAIATPVTEAPSGLQRLPTYLGVSGLSGTMLTRLQRSLDRHGSGMTATSAGGMRSGLPVRDTPFAPGEPVGSVLSWGDMTIWAAGTVTLTCDEGLMAYGHSLFYDPPGELRIGMTGVDVVAVGNGQGLWADSMIPVLTEPRGTFEQDRFTGQLGVVGEQSPSMPITSEFSSLDTGRSRSGETDAIFQDLWYGDYEVWGHMVLNLGAVQQEVGPGTVRYGYTIDGTRADGSAFTVENRTMAYSDS